MWQSNSGREEEEKGAADGKERLLLHEAPFVFCPLFLPGVAPFVSHQPGMRFSVYMGGFHLRLTRHASSFSSTGFCRPCRLQLYLILGFFDNSYFRDSLVEIKETLAKSGDPFSTPDIARRHHLMYSVRMSISMICGRTDMSQMIYCNSKGSLGKHSKHRCLMVLRFRKSRSG